MRTRTWNRADPGELCGPRGRAARPRGSAYRARIALVALLAYVQGCSQPVRRGAGGKAEHVATLIRVERPAGIFFFPGHSGSETPVTRLTVRIEGDSDPGRGREYTLLVDRDYDPRSMGAVGDRVVFIYDGLLPVRDALDRQRLAGYAVQGGAR